MLTLQESFSQTASVTGKWKMDFEQSLALSPAERISRIETASQEHFDRLRSSFESRVFRFYDNGTFTVNWVSNNQQREHTGTWQQTNNRLELSDTFSASKTWYIERIDSAVMVLDMRTPSGLFSKLYLKRIND